METSAESTRAIETLDKALEEVSSAQAKLGAIQNRLQHNIDNLSKGAMLTEQSVGRVVDADFATETSNLSKQQILNQAATAMLAQANQSKQSVLICCNKQLSRLFDAGGTKVPPFLYIFQYHGKNKPQKN